MPTPQPKQILIAPLDWGLGHTARCVPIIRYLRSLGHNAVVACNRSQRSFIEETFGAIDIIHLEGYNITYSGWNKWGQIGLLSQMPGIVNTIRREHEWLSQLARQRHFDGIISDNRYGLSHPQIPSVIMTHQLNVQSGIGEMADGAVRRLHYKYLNRFNATWVVDVPGIPNLAGKLSHPEKMPHHAQYIGLLSRFENNGLQNKHDNSSHLLILLSGPEPQRTALSKMLWQQIQHLNLKITFIEGSDSVVPHSTIPENIIYYNRLTDEKLLPILQNASIVLCRSGYSTLMDLIAVRKKAMLIPTPAQTEQEYLGRFMHDRDFFYCASQDGFEINDALGHVQQFPFKPVNLQTPFNLYKPVIDDWLKTL